MKLIKCPLFGRAAHTARPEEGFALALVQTIEKLSHPLVEDGPARVTEYEAVHDCVEPAGPVSLEWRTHYYQHSKFSPIRGVAQFVKRLDIFVKHSFE